MLRNVLQKFVNQIKGEKILPATINNNFNCTNNKPFFQKKNCINNNKNLVVFLQCYFHICITKIMIFMRFYTFKSQ